MSIFHGGQSSFLQEPKKKQPKGDSLHFGYSDPTADNENFAAANGMFQLILSPLPLSGATVRRGEIWPPIKDRL